MRCRDIRATANFLESIKRYVRWPWVCRVVFEERGCLGAEVMYGSHASSTLTHTQTAYQTRSKAGVLLGRAFVFDARFI